MKTTACPKSRYGKIRVSKMILRTGNNKCKEAPDHIWLAVVPYEVLVISLFARVPHTLNCCHNKQRIMLVLGFALVFWHQKSDQNARYYSKYLTIMCNLLDAGMRLRNLRKTLVRQAFLQAFLARLENDS